MNREAQILNIIKNTLTYSEFLGDDCALLKDYNLCFTQDNLYEDVHFDLSTTSAFSLGYKSVSVNLSDLASNLAKPKYITIGISVPNYISNDFIKDFYLGVNNICNTFDVKVIGGDITSGSKLAISICAIGEVYNGLTTNRNGVCEKDVIVTTGVYGSSAFGLDLLKSGAKLNCAFIYQNVNLCELDVNHFILSHIQPECQILQSNELKSKLNKKFAMMDTSDGLADALYQLAVLNNFTFIVDFTKIPIYNLLYKINDYKNYVLFGGEDYNLLFTVKLADYKKLDPNRYFKIGYVTKKILNRPVIVILDNKNTLIINENTIEKNSFNHFGEKK